MEPPEIKTSDQQAGGAPFQYSLRTMFIVMTVVAVALSGILAGPRWLTVLTAVLLDVMTPMLLTIGLIYGRGYLRTFCIGGLFPTGAMVIALGLEFVSYRSINVWEITGPAGEFGLSVGVFILAAYVVTIAFGLVAVGVRWMIEAGQREEHQEGFVSDETSQSL
jgi:hypothetical protein